MKIKLKIEDIQTRQIWDAVLRAKTEVESWPAWKRGEDVDDKQILIDKINNITNMIHDDIGRGKVNRIYVDEQKLQDYLMLHTEDKKLVDEFIKETKGLEEKCK